MTEAAAPAPGLLRGAAIVAVRELRSDSRSRAHFVWRTVYVALLFGIVFIQSRIVRGMPDPSLLPTVGRMLFIAYATLQGVLVALVSPGAAAAALAPERERRTLGLLLMSPLRPSAVVLGKWAAAVAWMALLVASGIPVLALVALFGGVGPSEIAAVLVLTMGTILVATAAGTVAASRMWSAIGATIWAWVGLLVLYGIVPAILHSHHLANAPTWAHGPPPPRGWGIAGLTGSPVYDLFVSLHPAVLLHRSLSVDAFSAGSPPGFALIAIAFALLAVTAGAMVVLASWSLRRTAAGERSGGLRAAFRRIDAIANRWNVGGIVLVRDRPLPPRGNPVAWLEAKRRGLLRVRNRLRLALAFVVLETLLVSVLLSLQYDIEDVLGANMILVAGALPLLAVLLGGEAAAGERRRGTWEGLLATPLTGQQIAAGKILGIVRALLLPVLATAVLGAVFSWVASSQPEDILVVVALLSGAVLLCLALALAFSIVAASAIRAEGAALGVAALGHAGAVTAFVLLDETPRSGTGAVVLWSWCGLTIAALAAALWGEGLLPFARRLRPRTTLAGLLVMLVVGLPGAAGLLERDEHSGLYDDLRVAAWQWVSAGVLTLFLLRRFDALAGRSAGGS